MDISTRVIAIVGVVMAVSVVGFAVTRVKPKSPEPIAAVETPAPTVVAPANNAQPPDAPSAPANNQASDVPAAPADDVPMSGTLIGGPAADATATRNIEADEAAARLDDIDAQQNMNAQAQALAAERARTDAAVAQARALANQNAALRQQTEDAEYERTQAEQAAYEAQQQQPAVVFIQPGYVNRRDIYRHGRYPDTNDNRRPGPNTGLTTNSGSRIDRKNVVTTNATVPSQPVRHQVTTASKPTLQNVAPGNATGNQQAAAAAAAGKAAQQ